MNFILNFNVDKLKVILIQTAKEGRKLHCIEQHLHCVMSLFAGNKNFENNCKISH